METLKAGGNVLIPVLPTGFVFDAVELIIRSIDQTVSHLYMTYFYTFFCSEWSTFGYTGVFYFTGG